MIDSIYYWWKVHVEITTETQRRISEEAEKTTAEINEKLQYLMNKSQELANSLTNNQLAYNNIPNAIQDMMIKNHQARGETEIHFYSLSVSFDKGMYSHNQSDELANWMYYFDKKTAKLLFLKKEYDYTAKNNPDHNTEWFTKAVSERKGFWSEPRFDNMTDEFVITYSVPFFTSSQKEKVAGVVAFNITIDGLKTTLYGQDYRKTGFSILLSEQGNLIYHPNRMVILASTSQDKDRLIYKGSFELIDRLKQNTNDDFQLQRVNRAHQAAWVLSKQIAATHWRLYVLCFSDELKIEQKTIFSNLRLVVSSVVFVITLAAAVLLRRNKRENFLAKQDKKSKSLWHFSISAGVVFCLGIMCLWYLADAKDVELQPFTTKLQSVKEILASEKRINTMATIVHKRYPFYIPTGVFIKATEFTGSNNINISGYIWQKYQLTDEELAKIVPDNFCDFTSARVPKDKGVILFEAEEDKIDLSCKDVTYASMNDGVVTLGWYFKVQLREPFDYSDYPLDKNLIWLRLRPNSFAEKIVLTPDLRAYPFVFEKALAGIDSDNLVLPSWDVLGTFYTTKDIEINANLGVNGYEGQYSQELLFNILIERDFLDAFISTVVPICIIYLILFVILFSTLEDVLAVLGINAGLLFSVALWHSTLRTSLASTGITYFESFYFICYFVISLICINSVLLASNYPLPLLHYRNNLIPKLAFFPLVAGLTFFTTLFMLF